jgi:hydroxymethylpyrimidine pyrophosphatase-like HAD family hydrolase
MNMFRPNAAEGAIRPLVLTDLDDTIFRNVKKVSEGELDGSVPVVMDTGGRVSVMTQRQAAFFEWIRSTCDIIPVTARSLDAFRKINISFGEGWKIAGNGSVVIKPDGEIDEDWAQTMRDELVGFTDILKTAHDAAWHWIKLVELEVEFKRYSEHGVEHCILFASKDPSCTKLSKLAYDLRYDGLHTHFNGGTLAFTAAPVSKKRASEYVLSKIEGLDRRPVLAFGDSLSDLPFMSLGDFVCAPTGSQISEKTLKGVA